MHVFDQDCHRHDVEFLEGSQILALELDLKVILVSHDIHTIADALSRDGGRHVVLSVSGAEDLEVNILAAAHSAEFATGNKGDHLFIAFLVREDPSREPTPRALLLVNLSQAVSGVRHNHELLGPAATFGRTRVAHVTTWTAASRVGAVERADIAQLWFAALVKQRHLERRDLFATLSDKAIRVFLQRENRGRLLCCLNAKSVGDLAARCHLEAFTTRALLLDVNGGFIR